MVRWLRNAHVAKHLRVEKPTQKLRSFFSRWSINFSVEYYEAKEQQATYISRQITRPRSAKAAFDLLPSPQRALVSADALLAASVTSRLRE